MLTLVHMWNFDLLYTLGLFSLVAVVGLAYALRVLIKGRARFERVEKQGGSALLNKGAMEMAYWGIQPIAKALIAVGMTPNQISWASFVFGFFAATSLAFGHFGSAAVFATISGFLDSLDGIVARLTGVSSDAGEVLDAAVDRYVEFMFVGGLVIYYREIPAMQVLALLALAGSFMVSYSTAKAEALQISPPKGSMRRPERAFYLTLGAALSPISIYYFEQAPFYAVPMAHPMAIALGLVAFVGNFSAVERLWSIAKTIRAQEAARVSVQSLAEQEHHESDPSAAHSKPAK